MKQKGLLDDDVVAVRIDGHVIDLHTPVEQDATCDLVRATAAELPNPKPKPAKAPKKTR